MTTNDDKLNTPRLAAAPNGPCWCGSGRKYKNCHRRRDKEQAELTAAAMHEAAHAIADFHYGVPIGDGGVVLTDEGTGYTDARTRERWGGGKLAEFAAEERLSYRVANFIGPVAEFRHRNMTCDHLDGNEKIIRLWMGDFATAMGETPVERTTTVQTLDYEAFARCVQLTLRCFHMLANPEDDTPSNLFVGGTDVGGELKEAMLAADRMASVYAAEIANFANLLLAKKRVSKEECAEWAHGFCRKLVRLGDLLSLADGQSRADAAPYTAPPRGPRAGTCLSCPPA